MWCGKAPNCETTANEAGAVFTPAVTRTELADAIALASGTAATLFTFDRVTKSVADTQQALASAMMNHPVKARAVALMLVAFCALLGSLHPSSAQNLPGGFLDRIQQDFATFGGVGTGGSWMDNSLAYGKTLFMGIGGIAVAYNLMKYFWENSTLKGSIPMLVRVIMMIGMPLAILQFVAPAILNNVFELAADLMGKIDPKIFPGLLTPSGIFNEGATVAQDFAKSYATGVFDNFMAAQACPNGITGIACWANSVGSKIMQIFYAFGMFGLIVVLCVIVQLMFAFIAMELLFAYAYAYLTLPLGAWTLGFSASSATSHFAEAYWSSVLKVLMRFLCIFAVAAFVEFVFANMATDIQKEQAVQWNFTDPIAFGKHIWDYFQTALGMMVDSVALAFLVLRTAQTANSMGGGSPSLSFAGGVGAGIGMTTAATRLASGGGGGGGGGAGGGGALGAAAAAMQGAAAAQRGSAAELASMMQSASGTASQMSAAAAQMFEAAAETRGAAAESRGVAQELRRMMEAPTGGGGEE